MPPTLLPRLLRDERGGDLLEYALIAGLVAATALVIYLNLSRQPTLGGRLANSINAGVTAGDKPTMGTPSRGGCPDPPCRKGK